MPDTDIEQDFELEVVVKINGYGREVDKVKLTSELKRLIEVNFHTEVQTDLLLKDGSRVEVLRQDRNARQDRGEIEG